MNRRTFLAKTGAIVAATAVAPALATIKDEPKRGRLVALTYNFGVDSCTTTYTIDFDDRRTDRLINGAFRMNCS
jgi:hypothetical protein